MAHSSYEPTTSAKLTRVDALATQFLDRIFRRKKDATKPEARLESLPWESWELDKNFFKALTRWTLDNPERSLDRVLDHICDGLENNKDLFQLIPETPFPARGLLTALAHLFKLGVKVSRAKKDVQEFAKDVVRWVGLIKGAFESPGDGRFTRQAWRNLRDMRDLIDEICAWAVKRLQDGRWSRIGHGLIIQKEILEFQERIACARALFQDLSSIDLVKGLDIVIKGLAHLFERFERQELVVAEIQKIRQTQEKHFDQLMSEFEKQKQIAERNQFFAETLNVHAVANPTYDGQGKRPCDEDTRSEVLETIRKWVNDISPGTPNFLWLTGNPGCGKSAVTASLARECKDEGVLWAQFFINRNNAETTDPRSYFPSIARQLANRSNDVAETIHHILQNQLSLLDDISANQASQLFVKSALVASEVDSDRPVVIIIDGLDETSRDRLEDTAKIFATLFASLETRSNVKIFVSSRTENEIQKSFVLPNSNNVVRVHLDTADPSSIRDVSQYIRRNLAELVKDHDLNWDAWPGDERARALGERASGLFIWGVTAIKFIQEQLYSHGEECLDDLLNMLTADVLDDINALYTLILHVTHRGHQNEWEFERFRRIVGAIVFLQQPLSIDDLATLLDLRKTPSSKPADIAHFVRRFRTILVTGIEAIDGSTVPRIHKSVFEFITSNSVDSKFRVDSSQAHLELGVQCLAHLGAAQRSATKHTLPVLIRYASRFWSSHLSWANALGHSSICADSRQSSSATPLPLSLKTMPLVHKPTWVRYSAITSQIKIEAGTSTTWDALSGAPVWPVSYHTNFITGMLFSPDCKQIVSCSYDKTIRVWDSTNDRWTTTLVNHSSGFRAIAFSPDGRFIVSGSSDGLVCLWVYSTGAPVGKPLQGHKGPVTCLAFSADGKRIVSGSDDKTCIFWNASNRQALGEPWTGHKHPVTLVALSTNGQRVCSIDTVGYCIIWDVSKRRQVSIWQYGRYPCCLSFLPNDDNFVAVGGSEGVKMRTDNQEWLIPDSEYTRCLSFSSNGNDIIFATEDAIYVAEINREDQAPLFTRKADYHSRAAEYTYTPTLSPKSDYFAYADEADAIHLFALQHEKTSLKVVPFNSEKRTTGGPNARMNELAGALSSMEKVDCIHDALRVTNRRLGDTTWYEAGLDGCATEYALRACVVSDDAVVAGYKDGAVSVWNQCGVID